ncbi:MAG TPA: hypothetical protein VKA46_40410 [Gemmataceae bacterium]|nr:hypothetical protein [Gemmataceae bacterium]
MTKLVKPLALILGLGLVGGLVGTGAAWLMRTEKPAAEPVRSGPQVEEDVPGPFEPLTLNGRLPGQKDCQFCLNGRNPVAMIFARSLTGPVTTLIKKLDAETAAHADAHMGSCVIFLSNDKSLPDKLKDLAGKEKIEHTVLGIYARDGPHEYKISKDAEVTVLLYREVVVKANHAFGKGQLSDSAIDEVIADLPKILAKG